MDTEEQYVPEVNDYVIWENDLGTIDAVSYTHLTLPTIDRV